MITATTSRKGSWIQLNERRAAGTATLLLLLQLALPAAVQAQFNYWINTNNHTVTITGYTGPGGVVTIPDTINGLPVTSIGAAFYNCTSLTSVTIPNSVTSIGDIAFMGCTSLTNVTIPNSVTNIGQDAFDYCTSLTDITIPNGVKNIGFEAFQYCSRLTTLTIADGVGQIGDQAFYRCFSLTSVTIPNSVGGIGNGAFGGCFNLANVTILAGSGEIDIFGGAFWYCTNLTSVTIGNGVAFIAASAFYLTSLTNVTIPASVISIGSDAFSGCPLTAITVDPFNSHYSSLGGVLFDKGQTLLIQCPPRKAGSYTIPGSVTSIGAEAFDGCSSLTSITIPGSVTSFGDRAFAYCTSLTNVTTGNGVTRIGASGFAGCSSLTNIIIPGSVTGIGDSAFVYCWNLIGVYFEGNAPNLGSSVFEYDSNATVYYLRGTTGWGTTFGDRPTAVWIQMGPPQVSTLPATGVSTSSAALNGTVNPSGWPTTAWYQWGATTNYGNLTSVIALGSGTTALPLSATLAGLTPSVTYHFRVAATNDNGLVYGSDQSFTTASFTDADWVGLGSGIDGFFGSARVYALAVSGTNLYAGGYFSTAGGVSANYIAKWDGRAWSALGSGMDGTVEALAVIGTNLYAGGGFDRAGGVTANLIAKWDGSAWSALGSGMNGDVEALAAIGSNLYAMGSFTTAGGVPANYIAKWDGSAWSALGSGLGWFRPTCYALAVSGANLYAGGDFSVPAVSIAKWNGRAWSGLDSGPYYISALAVSGADLYAGGNFLETQGGVPANYVAKWDGSAWSALGLGLSGCWDQCDHALAVSGADLYAGGQFTTAGGAPAANIAKWDGSAWTALGSGVNGLVDVLAADGAGHLFVGGMFTMAGTNVCQCIAQANVGSAPTVLASPLTQTAEAGATVTLAVDAAGNPPLAYQWYLNGSNLCSCTTSNLVLTNILFSQSGTYTVVLTNMYGALTSAPVMVNVIPAVERRPVPGVKVTGQTGSLLNVDYANSVLPEPNWTPLGSVSLTSTSGYCFDLTLPLPPQRFYRAWQTTPPSQPPTLDLHLVPAITLTGTIGSSLRVDYINRLGPIDAWVMLATVTLTNTSQLYFDVSAPGQPERLYRLVPSP